MKKVFYLLLFISISICAKPTLNQEIGQMIMVGFNGTTLHKNDPVVQDLIQQRIGGVILFNKNIKNPQQLKRLTKQLRYYAKTPLLIGIDYEGGTRGTRLQPSKGFPKTYNAQYLDTKPLSVTQKQANLMAKILKKAGINLDFAPVVDLNINPNNPVIGKLGRSFSRDPEQVIEYAKIYTDTYKKHHILCVLKHFPGHGSSTKDSHLGLVDVTKTWQPKELIPYKQLIKLHQGCDLIMTAHIVNTKLDPAGYPTSLSYQMTTKLLRQQLGFRGIIVTDDLQMQAITDKYQLATTVKLAIQSGADILLFGNQLKYQPQIASQVITIVDKLVADGVISRQRIDASYQRINDYLPHEPSF